ALVHVVIHLATGPVQRYPKNRGVEVGGSGNVPGPTREQGSGRKKNEETKKVQRETAEHAAIGRSAARARRSNDGHGIPQTEFQGALEGPKGFDDSWKLLRKSRPQAPRSAGPV